jgi:hypothetical protein
MEGSVAVRTPPPETVVAANDESEPIEDGQEDQAKPQMA